MWSSNNKFVINKWCSRNCVWSVESKISSGDTVATVEAINLWNIILDIIVGAVSSAVSNSIAVATSVALNPITAAIGVP